MSELLWEVYAVKYADRNDRTRNDSFMFDSDHNSTHPMDYFVWVLRSGAETILVDTDMMIKKEYSVIALSIVVRQKLSKRWG